MHKLKVLGLAFVAIFAMSAVAASAASAATFMSEGNVNAKVSADQISGEEHIFSVEGNKVECETAHFATAGFVASPSEKITVHPEYSGCTAFGFVNATVETTGCDYVLNANGPLAVSCSGTSEIVITASTCQAKVASQSLASGLSYTNNGGGTVTVSANVSGITATKTKDGFLCPFSGTGTVSNATYTGGTIASGEAEGGGSVAITVE